MRRKTQSRRIVVPVAKPSPAARHKRPRYENTTEMQDALHAAFVAHYAAQRDGVGVVGMRVTEFFIAHPEKLRRVG